MSTSAKPGIGASLKRWNTTGTTGVWQEITEVTAISWGGASRNVIETFRLNNSDEYVNKLQGVINAGAITVTCNFKQSEFEQLKADFENRGNIDYQIVFPDGQGLEWAGFISELPLDIGSDDVMKGDFVFQIDGKPDFVSSASPSA